MKKMRTALGLFLKVAFKFSNRFLYHSGKTSTRDHRIVLHSVVISNPQVHMVDRNYPREYLVRYGAVPEVARCQLGPGATAPTRGDRVVVETHRGPQLGEVLGDVRSEAAHPTAFSILRVAESTDLETAARTRQAAADEFDAWVARVTEWQIDLQLIDLERTLDGSKLILYVLNERGPECTKLAIQAAASGFGIIEVQPVGPEGLVSQPGSGGGCGSAAVAAVRTDGQGAARAQSREPASRPSSRDSA